MVEYFFVIKYFTNIISIIQITILKQKDIQFKIQHKGHRNASLLPVRNQNLII